MKAYPLSLDGTPPRAKPSLWRRSLETTATAFLRREIEETFILPSGDAVQVSSAWRRSAQNFTVTWHYDHLLPDGLVERLTAQAVHSLEPPEVYLAALEGAGLHPGQRHGPGPRGPAVAYCQIPA